MCMCFTVASIVCRRCQFSSRTSQTPRSPPLRSGAASCTPGEPPPRLPRLRPRRRQRRSRRAQVWRAQEGPCEFCGQRTIGPVLVCFPKAPCPCPSPSVRLTAERAASGASATVASLGQAPPAATAADSAAHRERAGSPSLAEVASLRGLEEAVRGQPLLGASAWEAALRGVAARRFSEGAPARASERRRMRSPSRRRCTVTRVFPVYACGYAVCFEAFILTTTHLSASSSRFGFRFQRFCSPCWTRMMTDISAYRTLRRVRTHSRIRTIPRSARRTSRLVARAFVPPFSPGAAPQGWACF